MSIIIEKNKNILGASFEAELNDGTKENLTLKPVAIKHWNELDSSSVDNMDILLIAYTTGKGREWVEEKLAPDCFCSLYSACAEVNKGFFDRLNDLQPKLLQDVYERNAKLERIRAKYEPKQSSASESGSVTLQTT